MRIWCKLFEKNHMLKDTVMENYDMSMSRTAKVYDCLERACYEFDLEKPMWLDKINGSLLVMQGLVFIRITLLNTLILIILIFRLLRRIKKFSNTGKCNFPNIVILVEKKLLIISPLYAILPLRHYSVRE